MVLCGDRKGGVAAFAIGEGDGGGMAPVLYAKKTHRDCSVTSISWHDGKVLSTGRDGAVNTWRLQGGSGGGWGLVKESSIKLWGGIDDLHGVVWRGGGGMCVFGFEHTDFVVWDVGARVRLLKMPCGGGRRSWDFSLPPPKSVPGPRGGCCAFAWVRGGKVSVASWDGVVGGSEGGGRVWFHGREIHSVLWEGSGLLTACEDGENHPGQIPRPPFNGLLSACEDGESRAR